MRMICAGLALSAVIGSAGAVPATAATTSAPNSATASATTFAPAEALDPAAWSNRRLAAQLVMSGIDMSALPSARPWVADGLGGVVLFGRPPADLAAQLQRLRSAHRVPPFIASDDEGGAVQRLRGAIYRLPSAEWLGRHRSPAQVERAALRYGRRMRALGVDVALAPVADLRSSGSYIERLDRAFAASPRRAATYVRAWQRGLRRARVVPVLKHWPGHGRASDTHRGPARTPPLAALERRDLVPFDRAVRDGASVVMVGHLEVPGLTESGRPATLSPKALRYLRARLGPRRLIITDSLSMGAIGSLGLTPADASVRTLRAGADMVLVDSGPGAVIDAVSRALRHGSYQRAHAIASVRRILAIKRQPTTSQGPAARQSFPPPALVRWLMRRPGEPQVAAAALRRRWTAIIGW